MDIVMSTPIPEWNTGTSSAVLSTPNLQALGRGVAEACQVGRARAGIPVCLPALVAEGEEDRARRCGARC